jgi:hypothetical protein
MILGGGSLRDHQAHGRRVVDGSVPLLAALGVVLAVGSG